MTTTSATDASTATATSPPQAHRWRTFGAATGSALWRLVAEGLVRQGLAESGCCPRRVDPASVELWLSDRGRGIGSATDAVRSEELR